MAELGKSCQKVCRLREFSDNSPNTKIT